MPTRPPTENPTSGFRPFFRSLALFIPFALAVYVVLVCAFGLLRDQVDKKDRKKPLGLFLTELPRNLDYPKGFYGHMFTRIREARKTRDVDILFIGSSHAYRSFDPRIFAEAGFKTFNLGSSQQTHIQTQVLLERYLDRLNPKIVFYEVFPSVFAADGVESALDIIANDDNDRWSLWMALKINHLKVWNALIYGLYRTLFNQDADFAEPLRRGNNRYIPGGFLQRTVTYYEEEDRNPKRTGWRQRPDQIQAFERNLDMIRARGCRLILIQAPWPRYHWRRYINRKAFDRQMNAYGEYYNFVRLMKLDDRLHFYDRGHLNQDGVELFNRELLRRMAREMSRAAPSPPSSVARGSRPALE